NLVDLDAQPIERIDPVHVAVSHHAERSFRAFRLERVGQSLIHLHVFRSSLRDLPSIGKSKFGAVACPHRKKSAPIASAHAAPNSAQRAARRSENSAVMRLTTSDAPVSMIVASRPEISTWASISMVEPCAAACSTTLNVIAVSNRA